MLFETRFTDKFSQVSFKCKIPFVKRDFQFNIVLYKHPDKWVVGWSSRTEQGRYVLFHDYDNLQLEDIVPELQFLQEKFHLSDYYVFELSDRKNSYHAVCLDTFSLREAFDIQQTTSCDLAFIRAVKDLHSKEWILRLGRKGNRSSPTYIQTIKSPYNRHIKSSAHAGLLQKMGILVDKTGTWDNCKNLSIIRYTTANRTN